MDQRVREELFPVAICDVQGEFENAEILTAKTDLQIGLDETHLVKIKGKGYIVLDFGKEIHGSVRLLTQVIEGGGCSVRIRTGESVAETYAELGEKNAGNNHSQRDFTTVVPIFSDLTFPETGFRFVRIDFCEDKTVFLKAVIAVYIHRDLHPVGSFVCNDERVNRIFEVASYTLTLNMQDYIWDGIKRDRLVWIGDMHPETLGITCLFGSNETVEKSLTYTTEHTPLPHWMNNIPTYTAWWFVILHDYYLQNGNIEYLRAQKDYIFGALKLLDDEVKEDGSIDIDETYLLDWPSHFSEDEKIGVHAVFALAAKKAESLLDALGLDTAVAKNLYEKLARLKNLSVEKFKQCEALLVFSGLKKAEQSYDFLVEGGAKGFSTFMSYYILSAIADAGRADCAVELMKEYYGAMLDLGATTFWEDFNLDWVKGSAPLDRLPKEGEKDIHGDFGDHCYIGYRHSLCHGWSCGPVSFLIKKLSGIEILEPGCKRVRVKPVSAGLEWYEIKYPTPFGAIEISYKGGEFTVKAPKGVILEK